MNKEVNSMYDSNNPAVLDPIEITAEVPTSMSNNNWWQNWNLQNMFKPIMDIGKNIQGSAVDVSSQHKSLPTTDRLNNWSNLIQGVGSLWNSWNYNKLAKKSLNHQMDVFNKNYEMTKNKINSQLEDRQRARVGANSSAYRSVDSYMNQYGVK